MKSVLAAIDFSVGSKQVIAEAITLARALGARLVVLHVVDSAPGSGASLSSPNADAAVESAANELSALQKKLQADAITIQTVHLTGHSGRRIVDYAEELRADFIVLGSHGHGARYEVSVGPTADHVLKRAMCPVVVVPQGPGRSRHPAVKPR